MGGEVLMHYYNADLKKDTQDPVWQNQALYFWENKEDFNKKSLPDSFNNLVKKRFILNDLPNYLTIKAGKAIPWFGKPGGGTKYYFAFNNNPITIAEAYELKSFSYIEPVLLTTDNLGILKDRENYIFLADQFLTFKDTLPFYKNTPTTLSELYKNGHISILKVL